MDLRTALEQILLHGTTDQMLVEETLFAISAALAEDLEDDWEESAAALEECLRANQGTLQPDFLDDAGCNRLRLKTLTQMTGLPYSILFPNIKDSLDADFVDALDFVLLQRNGIVNGSEEESASLSLMYTILVQRAPDGMGHFFSGNLKDSMKRLPTDYTKIFH